MGQAKRRGTFEDRKAQAAERFRVETEARAAEDRRRQAAFAEQQAAAIAAGQPVPRRFPRRYLGMAPLMLAMMSLGQGGIAHQLRRPGANR